MSDVDTGQTDDLENDLPLESAELPEDIEVVIDESDEGDAGISAPEENQEVSDEAPEPEAEPEEATADDDDADLKAMPEKIKKRFMREKRLRDSIIKEREDIRGIAIQAATIAKQREDEVVTLRKQNAVLQKQFAETLDYAFTSDIEIVAAAVRKAREDGNYDEELKLQGKLDNLRFQQNQVRQAKTTLPDPEKVAPPPPQAAQQQDAPQAQQQQPRPPASPLAKKWIETNRSWFLNPKFKAAHVAVRAIDEDIAAEGYDKNTADYYKELDRRVDELFPTLRKKARPGSPVAPVGNAPASNLSSKTVRLTKGDLATMRAFGMDPQNKEHLREFARNKRAA